jgi:peptide/nickel transport system permease protein
MSETTDTVVKAVPLVKKELPIVNFLKRLVKDKPLGTVGGVIVLVMLLTGIFANFLAPYGYTEVHPVDKMQPPNAKYLLGTDGIGRDQLSRIIYGARVSMIIGLAATALGTVVGNTIGLVSGYMGGKFDLIIQRFVDAWISLPGLVIFLLLMSLIGAGMVQLILVLGIGGGIGGSRGARALAFWIKESQYVSASKSMGATTGRIVSRHLLPNVMPIVIISFSMGVGGTILAESSLSFLGLGVPPPQVSWGQMISGEARYLMEQAPWLAIWPGVALTLAVYGMNIFGDAVRDLLDPRLRGGVGGMGAYGSAQSAKALRKIQAKTKNIL